MAVQAILFWQTGIAAYCVLLTRLQFVNVIPLQHPVMRGVYCQQRLIPYKLKDSFAGLLSSTLPAAAGN